MFHIIDRFRCGKSQFFHPVLPHPEKIRTVRNVGFRECHQLSVKGTALQNLLTVACINILDTVAGTICINLCKIGKLIVFLHGIHRFLIHNHDIGNVSCCNHGRNANVIGITVVFINILVLYINDFADQACIGIVLIGFSLREIGIIHARHFCQRVRDSLRVTSVRRCFRFHNSRSLVPGSIGNRIISCCATFSAATQNRSRCQQYSEACRNFFLHHACTSLSTPGIRTVTFVPFPGSLSIERPYASPYSS